MLMLNSFAGFYIFKMCTLKQCLHFTYWCYWQMQQLSVYLGNRRVRVIKTCMRELQFPARKDIFSPSSFMLTLKRIKRKPYTCTFNLQFVCETGRGDTHPIHQPWPQRPRSQPRSAPFPAPPSNALIRPAPHSSNTDIPGGHRLSDFSATVVIFSHDESTNFSAESGRVYHNYLKLQESDCLLFALPSCLVFWLHVMASCQSRVR